MAVVATSLPALSRSRTASLGDALRLVLRHAPITAIVLLTVGIHIPTLHYFFFGDDFVVLGDINTRTFPQYAADVLRLHDLTPNWRPLTMLVYWGEFHAFGLDATAWRVVNLALHVATIGILYAFVLSWTRRPYVAALAALIFAVSASAVHTVTYITALPHVLSELLLVSSLYTLHRYVESGERRAAWYWGSLLLFIGGFLANEGGVVLVLALFAYFALASFARRRDPLDFVMKMMPFALVSGVLVGSLSSCGCQGIDGGFYGVGWHIPRDFWVYMSRLAYPVGEISSEPTVVEWSVGSAVMAAALFFLVRGPNIARVAVVGMIVGVLPYAPAKIWTATRYTYMSLPFFAIIIAIAAAWYYDVLARRQRHVAMTLGAAAILAVAGLYSWQTIDQSTPFLELTDRWQVLTQELEQSRTDVPAGTTIYIVDNEDLWTNPLWQPAWMKSVGLALYGEGVHVRALPEDDLARMAPNLDDSALLLRLRDGHLEPTTPADVRRAE